MLRNVLLKKSVVVFLLVLMLTNVCAPTISWALTSGPTAPEATSFEPVDTTDMVNLATGDFVYNLPLLEVPGPAGGYPLSLSYHAGIQPNEDASWVGLGWTLNPGAIARTVNGYPDDQLGAIRTRHDYNSGGARNTFSLGVGVPGASFNLAVSNDSNLGLGVGTSLTVGTSFGVGGPNSGVAAGISASVGDDPFSGGYAKAGVGISAGPAGVNLGIDSRDGASGKIGLAVSNSIQVAIQTDFKSTVGADLRYGHLGTSISSKGLKPNLSVAGYQISQVNSNSGTWTTKGWGISTPPIPIGPFTLTLGYNYMRYYSDETSDVNLIGTLKAASTNGKNPDTWAFDSYALLDPDAEGGVIKNNDPEKSKGGSFPAYDSYNVMAQGLGGSIQPYILENGTLFRQNLKNQPNNGDIIYNKVNNSFNFFEPVNFRFKNDFSNSYTFNQATMRVASNNTTVAFDGLSPTSTPPQGFNSTTNQLAGSKHIEYFTNQQIRDGIARDKGFVDCAPYTSREIDKYGYSVAEQVGGFMITNESGVTYHYAMPVYAYQHYSKSFQTGKETSVFQENTDPHPYAYTWYLTAVTGPDYVSRNSSNDGTISSLDWGYWVKFSYFQQSSAYTWRNPVEGTHKDIDREVENYSHGKKELFYLDRIETASHVAVFDKSERVDGRSVTSGIAGGFSPQPLTECRRDPNSDANLPPLICTTTIKNSVKTLKLDNIFLLSRSDYETTTASNYLSNSLRVISFSTNNSLTPGTSNSFADGAIETKLGKLTLKSLRFRGKGGAALVPPISFRYDKNPVFNKDAYDIWGLYKSDYVSSMDENIDRIVSQESAENVDAWSLTDITSQLGATISVDYESDKYLKVGLQKQQLLRIKNATIENGNLRVYFFDQVDVNSNVLINSVHDIVLVGAYKLAEASSISCGACPVSNVDPGCLNVNYPYRFTGKGKVISTEQTNNSILFESQEIVSHLNSSKNILWEYKNTSLCYSCSFPLISCVFSFVGSAAFPRFITGGFITTGDFEKCGGGVRVKSISLQSSGEERITSYSYSDGATSFEPFEILPSLINPDYAAIVSTTSGAKKEITKASVNYYSKSISIAREIPAPGIMYGKVIVEEEIKRADQSLATKIPGKKVFEFQVFDEGMVERLGITTTSSTGLCAVECFDSSGNPTNCGPPPHTGSPPVFCKDQNGNTIGCNTFCGTTHTPLTLKDFSAWVGALKSVTTYGPNDEILEKTTNHYLHDYKTTTEVEQQLKTKFNGQGIISQTFNENRSLVGYIFSRRDEYPLVSVGQTSTNYKTGITTTSRNLAFDFYTGNPLKVLSTDGYGNKYVTESTPAHTIADYSGTTSTQIANGFIGMGLKVNNLKNKHMLTQAVSSQTFKVNDNYETSGSNVDKLALVSASAQTWSDQVNALSAGSGGINAPQIGVWRQRANFNFMADDNISLRPDGLYPYANFTEFNAWTGDVVPTNWKKLSEIKLFDTYSHALEATDMNGNYAATKMSLDQTRVFATASNAQYHEFAFSGLEEAPGASGVLGGGVTLIGQANPVAHTGVASVSANAGQKGFSYSFTNATAKKYHIAVWSNKADGKIIYKFGAGADQTATITNSNQSGTTGWYLLEADVDIPASTAVQISCQANTTATLFDDFRVHPLKAAMVSYVYNKWGELTHILDNNNLFTEYEYDGMGRLKKVNRETFQFGKTNISEVVYHYNNQN